MLVSAATSQHPPFILYFLIRLSSLSGHNSSSSTGSSLGDDGPVNCNLLSLTAWIKNVCQPVCLVVSECRHNKADHLHHRFHVCCIIRAWSCWKTPHLNLARASIWTLDTHVVQHIWVIFFSLSRWGRVIFLSEGKRARVAHGNVLEHPDMKWLYTFNI